MTRSPATPSGRLRAIHTHHLYGVRLRSQWPLRCPEGRGPDLAEVELVEGPASLFWAASREAARRSAGDEWFHYRRLPDGSDYVRWSGLFEFLIAPDGGRITCRALDGGSREAFHTYLLGQVLSFALLKHGIEPLHATAVVVGGSAAAFVGDCGRGKSSLGAAFLQAGHALLTDDLLVVRPDGGRVLAYPGPPRIKLFPEVATVLLGERVTGAPMNPLTPKQVIPLPPNGKTSAPLGAIYVLRPPNRRAPRGRVVIRPLAPRRACLELLRSTFNAVVVEPARCRRQLTLAARLARTVPVKSLSFPRGLTWLPAVRETIESDLLG